MNIERLRHQIASAFEIVKERSTNEEIVIICPVPGCPDKSGNRSINTKTLLTHCHRCAPGAPGHLKSLFRSIGLSLEDEESALDPAELLSLLHEEKRPALTPVQHVSLPEGFETLSENRDCCYWRFCKQMAERKNLGIEDLEEAGAGFTREGDWEPFCIFPVYESGRTVYYQGRTYLDDGFEKTKKFPSRKVVPYGAKYWVYGLDALASPKVKIVVIVESILNHLSLRRKLRETGDLEQVVPVCVFTHALSVAQVAKLKRYTHIAEWCILFDSDSYHLAQMTGCRLSVELPVVVAEMPHGKNPDGTLRLTNDANDDVESALVAISRSQAPREESVSLGKWNKGHSKGALELFG